ncbi:MAG: hypothetical protein U0840_20400 [Gemmataceae bacterium]
MVETPPMFGLGMQEILILVAAALFVGVALAVAYNVMRGKDDHKD